MRLLSLSAVLVLACAGLAQAAPRRPARPAPPALGSLIASPAAVLLEGAGARQQLLVTGVTPAGQQRDFTGSASYRVADPRVAVVGRDGVVRGLADGTTTVEAAAGGRIARLSVRVRASRQEAPLGFARDVLPVLARAGCAGAACHAKQGGKNGFQLSVLSFDPHFDYDSVVLQSGGRRVNRLEPERSLLLQKATLSIPHGGGRRFEVVSPEYRLLARWIAEGASYGKTEEPALARVEVEPRERTMAPKSVQQLRATAIYADGSRRDVTALAEYLSNETGIAEVDEHGRVRSSSLAGEAAVMVRYQGQVAVASITLPLRNSVSPASYAGLPVQNFIDPLVYRKLARLNLMPSAPCDDAAFLRRASLDLIGTLPTPQETRAFLAECESEAREQGRPGGSAPARQGADAGTPGTKSAPPARPALKARERLVRRLLDRPEYADYWATRWVNLLLVDRDPLFPKGAFAYDRWVREAFQRNMPYDQFAREIVTAQGETYRNGPANFYRALATPVEQSKSLSQLFLGVRVDCAQCHHHPFERWGQDDFYSMAAFFARVRQKYSSEFEIILFSADSGEVKHPKTDQVMPLRPLGGPVLAVEPEADRRVALAEWMTAKDNPFFARAIVNRVWGLLMGRGIVEPVDDFRVTNPASNDALLDALAKDFTEHGYDLKHLFRTITASAAYQRSSEATPNNAKDTRNYARYYVKRLPAEVLLDAVVQVTGVPEVYPGHPAGTRAIQMWDNKLPVEFLEVFGRPSRLSVCECDRPADGSVTQVLHLMNSPAIHARLTADTGAAATLDKSGQPEEEVVTELYLRAYSRLPRPDELKAALGAFRRPGATRRQAIEDLLWALLNSPEFLMLR